MPITERDHASILSKYRVLLYHLLGKYKSQLSATAFEELENDCRYAIIRAIESYDADHPSKASPDTLVGCYIKLEIKRHIHESGYKGRSFEESLESFPDDETISIIEADPSDAMMLDAAIASIQDDRCRDIVERVASGETMANIGREYGISRERVRQVKRDGVQEMGENVGRKMP